MAKSLVHQGFPVIGLLLAWHCAAAPPVLSLPVDCRVGVDCHIQNYVDHDTGPDWRDYACGTLSYDAHAGTDFRLPDLAAMRAGVNVLAAAAGTVAAVRDGEPDININQRGRAALQGRDAGNSVRIVHDGGWETQYSHLMRGSVSVQRSQTVEAGTVLGKVGLSGRTEFPHLDFAVRHQGRTVDPFAPANPVAPAHAVTPANTAATANPLAFEGSNCGATQSPLWHPALQTALSYRPTGLLAAGFAPSAPERARAQDGGYAATQLTSASPTIAFWIELFGLQKDDVLELTLLGPSGQTLAQSSTRAERNQALRFGFAGKRRGATPWEPGSYSGRVVLRRGQTVVIDETRSATLPPP